MLGTSSINSHEIMVVRERRREGKAGSERARREVAREKGRGRGGRGERRGGKDRKEKREEGEKGEEIKNGQVEKKERKC